MLVDSLQAELFGPGQYEGDAGMRPGGIRRNRHLPIRPLRVLRGYRAVQIGDHAHSLAAEIRNVQGVAGERSANAVGLIETGARRIAVGRTCGGTEPDAVVAVGIDAVDLMGVHRRGIEVAVRIGDEADVLPQRRVGKQTDLSVGGNLEYLPVVEIGYIQVLLVVVAEADRSVEFRMGQVFGDRTIGRDLPDLVRRVAGDDQGIAVVFPEDAGRPLDGGDEDLLGPVGEDPIDPVSLVVDRDQVAVGRKGQSVWSVQPSGERTFFPGRTPFKNGGSVVIGTVQIAFGIQNDVVVDRTGAGRKCNDGLCPCAGQEERSQEENDGRTFNSSKKF